MIGGPGDQIRLYHEVADQRLLLVLTQLVIQRLYDPLPVLFAETGVDRFANILRNQVALPELGARLSPAEEPTDIHADIGPQLNGTSQRHQIDFILKMTRIVEIEVIHTQALIDAIGLP